MLHHLEDTKVFVKRFYCRTLYVINEQNFTSKFWAIAKEMAKKIKRIFAAPSKQVW